jgi:predicted metalloprotease with PDZ domain
MEHSCSTAIDVSLYSLRQNPRYLAQITAHEFFHLWNVRRIRPASLEPVDYTRENFTPALWFSEGVTSTVAGYLLLRAGLDRERDYLEQLAKSIGTLENRPAARFQSLEESSLDTWFDKYGFYRHPGRSISYYNKGEIVGVLLDLAIRDASGGRKSLRDLFHWMNRNFAMKGSFFPDSEGVRQAAEAVTGKDFRPFFSSFIAGTEPLPYDRLFATVGLRLQSKTETVPDLGFQVARELGHLPVVLTVQPDSSAETAGLRPGDTILEIDGRSVLDQSWERLTSALPPQAVVRLRIARGASARDLAVTVVGVPQRVFAIAEVENPSPAQRARRAAWLRGDSEAAGSAP